LSQPAGDILFPPFYSENINNSRFYVREFRALSISLLCVEAKEMASCNASEDSGEPPVCWLVQISPLKQD